MYTCALKKAFANYFPLAMCLYISHSSHEGLPSVSQTHHSHYFWPQGQIYYTILHLYCQ
jgi:hypothetical protein